VTDAGSRAEAGPRRRAEGHTVQVALVLCLAVLLGTAIGAAVHTLLRTQPRVAATAPTSNSMHGQARWPAGARPAPSIRGLHDQSGRVFALSSLRGRTVAIAFLDSRCTQACPLEGRALAAAERSLPAAQRPVLVAVSVNPQDTAASSRAAVRKWGLKEIASWHWLRGTHAQLARVWRAYHIAVAPPHDGDIAHTEALYLVDRRGDERSGYLYPFVPRFVTLDLRTLAGERKH
jgi:cytochrome oxidase Cu insertion factor (SCO1/SenC/PrrC family)